jgi:hypothetical protein
LKSQPLAGTLSSAKQVEDVEGTGSENWEDLSVSRRCGGNIEETTYEDDPSGENSPKNV